MINRHRVRHDHTLANIGNMDQTMCHFDMAPNITNNVQGGGLKEA